MQTYKPEMYMQSLFRRLSRRYDVEFLGEEAGGVRAVVYKVALLTQLVQVGVVTQSGTVEKRRNCGAVWKCRACER